MPKRFENIGLSFYSLEIKGIYVSLSVNIVILQLEKWDRILTHLKTTSEENSTNI